MVDELIVNGICEALRSTENNVINDYQEIAGFGLASAQFVPYVRDEISTSNIVLVVYSPDLRGGLIELGIASTLGVPVWLAVRRDERISSSTYVCAQQVFEYETVQELISALRIAT